MLLAAACARLGSGPPAGAPLPKGGSGSCTWPTATLAATERHHPAGSEPG